MSFFNKVLASVGIGAATVDTKLEKSSYTAGETINGRIEVSGGNISQQIEAIYLSVYTTYIRETNDRKYTDTAVVKRIKINEPFNIEANELRVIPFSVELPTETPVTIGKTKVWIQTGLDVKNAVDPSDKDFIKVTPSFLAANVLNEIKGLGFRLRKADCEKAPAYLRGRYPFIQEFEFVPTNGIYRGRLDELEVTFLSQSKQEAELLLQIDRKARGLGGFLAEALDVDETNVRLSITSYDIPNLNLKLKEVISRYM